MRTQDEVTKTCPTIPTTYADRKINLIVVLSLGLTITTLLFLFP